MKSGGFQGACAALVLVALAPALHGATTATLRRVELSSASADNARLILDLSDMPARKVFTIDKSGDTPHRIVIDLPATQLASGLQLPKAAGPVLAVRSGVQPHKTLRLVIEVTRKFEPAITITGSRLTIDMGVATQKPVAPAAVATPALPSPPVPVRASHAPEDTGRDIIIAVDAGHGGYEPGTLGAKGTMEKDVTLAIARLLAKRIDAEPGYRAYMTRNNDTYVALPDRRELAKKAGADIFVSIHADSYPKDRSVAGSSIYVLSERGASSDAARLLAEQENAVDGNKAGRGNDPVASILVDIAQNAGIGHSMEMAETVLPHLDRIGTVRKTKVQRAAFAVLKLSDIPSMLVETAYLSNAEEELKLRDPEHQKKIAEAIFNGVREYFRSNPPDGTLVARQRARPSVTPIIAGSTGP